MDLHDLKNILGQLEREPTDELNEQQLAAFRFLDENPELAREVRPDTSFDRELRSVILDVPVPDGLQQRLLAAMQGHSEPISAASQNVSRKPVSRRRAISLVTAACLLLLTAIFFAIPSQPTQFTAARMSEQLPGVWAQPLSRFDESFTTALPAGGWQSDQISFAPDWAGLDFVGDSADDLGLLRFKFRSRDGLVHEGLLAATTLNRLNPESHPAATDPFSGEVRYLKTPEGELLAVVSWREGETAYSLAVPAQDRSLQALEELLRVQAV